MLQVLLCSSDLLLCCIFTMCSVSDKVMLEAWLWDSPGNTTASQQAAVKIMGSFLSITPDLPRPREQLLLTRSFERYMLSQSVTDCYGVPEWAWGWANISTIEAADAAEQSWRKGGEHLGQRHAF
jgi:hypothetical protein